MGYLTYNKYFITVVLQYFCLLIDVGINSFCTFARNNPANMIILFVVQDICLIVSLTILLANFFSTYVFQAGLIQLLYSQFRFTLLICIVYITLSISLHSWFLTVHWSEPLKHFWPAGYHSLFSIHKSVAVFYYYLNKRASLRISDPKFHESSLWVQSQFSLS